MKYLRFLMALCLLAGVAWCFGQGAYLLWHAPFSWRWLVQVTATALAAIVVAAWLCLMVKVLWSANRQITQEAVRRYGPDFRGIEAAWIVIGHLAVLVLMILLMGWQLNPSDWRLALPTTWAEYFIWSWWLSNGLVAIAVFHKNSYNTRFRLRLAAYWQPPFPQVRGRPPQTSSSLRSHPSPGVFQRVTDGRIPLTPYADDRGPQGRPRGPLVQ